MPVIRSRDVNHIDVVAIEYRAIVFVNLGFAATHRLVRRGPALGVDVGNGQDIQPLFSRANVAVGHPACPDNTNRDAIVFRAAFLG